MDREQHWVLKCGMHGCIPDLGPEPHETLDECLDRAKEFYDLTTDQKNELRWHKLVELDNVHAEYASVECVDGPCPDDDEDSASSDVE